MDITKILDYQKLDIELFKLENAINENKHKKAADEMHKRAQAAQKRSIELEEQAKELVELISKVKEQFELQNKKLNQVLDKDVDKMGEKELENLSALKDVLLKNSNILDKNLSQLAEKVKHVLDEYQRTGKAYNEAIVKFKENKSAFDKEFAELEPKKKELEKQLSTQEKAVPKELLDKYKKLRLDYKPPLVVELRNNFCGGCNMELPMATISKIKENGSIQCEHCHRIIYIK